MSTLLALQLFEVPPSIDNITPSLSVIDKRFWRRILSIFLHNIHALCASKCAYNDGSGAAYIFY